MVSVLSEEEFNEWSNEYDEVRTSVSDRDEKLMNAQNLLKRTSL